MRAISVCAHIYMKGIFYELQFFRIHGKNEADPQMESDEIRERGERCGALRAGRNDRARAGGDQEPQVRRQSRRKPYRDRGALPRNERGHHGRSTDTHQILQSRDTRLLQADRKDRKRQAALNAPRFYARGLP